MSKLKKIEEAEDWFNNQLGLHAAVSLRNKYFPNLKINEMLTSEQIRHIYEMEVTNKP